MDFQYLHFADALNELFLKFLFLLNIFPAEEIICAFEIFTWFEENGGTQKNFFQYLFYFYFRLAVK